MVVKMMQIKVIGLVHMVVKVVQIKVIVVNALVPF